MTRCLTFVFLFVFPALASAGPRFSIRDKVISIEDVTPFASVAFYRVSRTPQGYESLVSRRAEILSDGDGDRTIAVMLPETPPIKSLWVAVDLTSGQVGIGSPGEATFRERETSRLEFRQNAFGAAAEFVTERASADVLLVRRQAGAWLMHLGDGGRHDADESVNGHIRALSERMTPVGSSGAAPREMLPNDVVIVIDASRMEYLIATLQK